jgi:hypothetical protein
MGRKVCEGKDLCEEMPSFRFWKKQREMYMCDVCEGHRE